MYNSKQSAIEALETALKEAEEKLAEARRLAEELSDEREAITKALAILRPQEKHHESAESDKSVQRNIYCLMHDAQTNLEIAFPSIAQCANFIGVTPASVIGRLRRSKDGKARFDDRITILKIDDMSEHALPEDVMRDLSFTDEETGIEYTDPYAAASELNVSPLEIYEMATRSERDTELL